MRLRLVLLIGVLSGLGVVNFLHAQSPTPYAVGACSDGCKPVKAGEIVYVGTDPRTYRICSRDSHSSTIRTEDREISLAGITWGERSCIDIRSKQIVLHTGSVWAGALP